VTKTFGKLNDIQWLRAAAALEVAIWHSDLITKNFSTLSVTAIEWYRPFGGIGVEVFFIVSGFVMCLRLPSYKSGAQFMYARLARLVPMYWVFTSLVIVAYLVQPSWRLNAMQLDLDLIVRSYLMLPQMRYPILGVGWSLEIEMIFYAELALVLTIAVAMGKRSGNVIVYLLVIAGLCGFAFGTGPTARVWDYHLISPYMLLFAFGWFMCAVTRTPAPGTFLGALIASAAVWLIGIALAESADRHLLLRMAAAAAVFVLTYALRAILQRDAFINRAASAVADASYSLYLSHWFVLSGLGKLLGALQISPAFDLTARIMGIAAAIAFALGCFRFFENPLDQLLRPRARRSKDFSVMPRTLIRSGYFVVPLDASTPRPNVASSTQHETESTKWR
jgi:peptidoglycan/LPS O-acetylase OafA/YrhL